MNVEVVVSPERTLGVVMVPKCASTSLRKFLYSQGWESICLSTFDGEFVVLIRDTLSRMNSGIRQSLVNSEIPIAYIKRAFENDVVLMDTHTVPVFDFLHKYKDKMCDNGIFLPFDHLCTMEEIFRVYGYDYDFSALPMDNVGNRSTEYDEVIDLYMMSDVFLTKNFEDESRLYEFLMNNIGKCDIISVREYLKSDILY